MATDDNISTYLGEVEKALSSGDKRAAAILINQVLKRDFSNVRAWRLLYRLVRTVQSFEDFQFEFASRFYPDKVHLLTAAIPDWLSYFDEQLAPSPSPIYAQPPTTRAPSVLQSKEPVRDNTQPVLLKESKRNDPKPHGKPKPNKLSMALAASIGTTLALLFLGGTIEAGLIGGISAFILTFIAAWLIFK
jgi:hypothetical protein